MGDNIHGPPKTRKRREPLSLAAVGAAVLIGAAGGAAGGAITSFAMSDKQQSKINEEIVNLGKIVGDITKADQANWAKQHEINVEFLKDRDEFAHRIEDALCAASNIHTENERVLELNNLRLQYRNSLSIVVNALTTKRFTPELIPISSIKKYFNTKGTLYTTDIL